MSIVANRPKDKGTWAESRVAEFLQGNGWPFAERRALAGVTDKGDITGCPGLVFEVKYANGGIRMGTWIAETYTEKENAGADHAALVIKPKGSGATNVAQWLAVMLSWDFNKLVTKATLTRAGITTFCSSEAAFVEGRVLADLREYSKSIEVVPSGRQIPVLTRRPPGTKETPGEWYRIMTLENITYLFRAAGYGNPLEVSNEEAQGLLVER